MNNRGLNVASREEVLQDCSAATGVPDEREPIGTYAEQGTGRFRHGIDELHGLRIVAGTPGAEFLDKGSVS